MILRNEGGWKRGSGFGEDDALWGNGGFGGFVDVVLVSKRISASAMSPMQGVMNRGFNGGAGVVRQSLDHPVHAYALPTLCFSISTIHAICSTAAHRSHFTPIQYVRNDQRNPYACVCVLPRLPNAQ